MSRRLRWAGKLLGGGRKGHTILYRSERRTDRFGGWAERNRGNGEVKEQEGCERKGIKQDKDG